MWSGVGIGGLIVPLYGWLVQVYGWRDTSIIIGFVIFLIGVPCGLVMRHNPYKYGDYPDGMKVSNDTDNDSINRDDESYTVKEALSSSSFWLLTMATGLRILVTSGVSLHLVPFFVDMGIGYFPVKQASQYLFFGFFFINCFVFIFCYKNSFTCFYFSDIFPTNMVYCT